MGRKRTAQKIKALNLERATVAGILAGKTFRQIGEENGVTAQAAHLAKNRAIARIVEDTKLLTEEARGLEIGRLDTMLAGVWQAATTGDLDAIDRVLRIGARRAALLGLDVPREVILRRMAGEVADNEVALCLTGLPPNATATIAIATSPQEDEEDTAGEGETG